MRNPDSPIYFQKVVPSENGVRGYIRKLYIACMHCSSAYTCTAATVHCTAAAMRSLRSQTSSLIPKLRTDNLQLYLGQYFRMETDIEQASLVMDFEIKEHFHQVIDPW